VNVQITKIILDADPGGDDSIAFLWLMSLAKQGVVEIVAVTSVDGNVHAKLTFAGSCKLLALGGFEAVEVGRGVLGGSLRPEVEDAGAIHGADGMGNLSQTLPIPQQSYETARSADDLLIEKLRESPGEIVILAIAPLTNLAAAERKSPGILKLAKQIVIMGGAFTVPGNITPEAEFNIAYDPDAAKLLCDRCNNLVMIPLDVTRKLIFTPDMAQQISDLNPHSPIARFLVSLCQFMTGTALAFRETGGKRGFLVHDAATLAYLFYPETLWFQRAQVWIEPEGDWTRGRTVIDRRHKLKASANHWVALDVESQNLLASLIEDLKILMDCET
jgi:inosine-uridine nucleoside N-ribohydrolase